MRDFELDKNNNLADFSPLALAYLGDAVFELLTRKYVLQGGNMPVNSLHNLSKKYVCALSQSMMYNNIFDKLSEEERFILKRGRNAKPNTVPKSASILNYKHATGLEALFGYLEIKKDYNRIQEIFLMCIAVIEESGDLIDEERS